MIKPIKEEKIMDKKTLVAKPKTSFENYLKIFSAAKGTFGVAFKRENEKARKEVEKRLDER